LANKFLTAKELKEPEAAFPLRVGFCHHCGHVQHCSAFPNVRTLSLYFIDVGHPKGAPS
jgi:hypothetical protein